MTKLVNLDELAAPKRSIKFKGVTHEVIDLPVAEFIEFQQDFTRLIEKQQAGDAAEMLAAAHSILARSVPSFTDYNELNLRQLMAAVQLIADFYPATEETGNE